MKENVKRDNKKGIVLVALGLLFLVTIGYAALTAQLTVDGTTKIKGNTWDVHLGNIGNISSQGATVTTAPTLSNNNQTVTFNVTLAKPGDYYEFTVDAINAGGINAKLASTPTLQGLTTDEQKFATYTVTYNNTAATSVSAGDTLPTTGTSTKTIRVRVEFKSDVANEDLPASDVTLTNLSLTLNYVQD